MKPRSARRPRFAVVVLHFPKTVSRAFRRKSARLSECQRTLFPLMASSKVREQVESYFRELNYASSRIMQDMSLVREAHGDDWDGIPEKQKTEIAWDALVGPEIKEKYNYYPKQYAEVEVFPVIGLNTGDRMVSDEDATNSRASKSGCWRDEHSAPFSWETQSQLNIRIIDDSVDEVDCEDAAQISKPNPTGSSAPTEPAAVSNSVNAKVAGDGAVPEVHNTSDRPALAKTNTFKPCVVSNSASEPNVGKVAVAKPNGLSNTLDKHVKFSNGVESKLPPAARSAGGSLPRVIHADPKAPESKPPEIPRPCPPSRSQESVSSLASRGSSNPPTPVERKGRRRAPTPPKAPPPDPPRPKTAPPNPPAAQKLPEAPRKHPSTKPPAPPIPKVKSPTREVAPKPANQEAPVPAAVPVRPPRLPSPPKEDPKPAEEPSREPVALRSPEGIPKTGFDFLDNW